MPDYKIIDSLGPSPGYVVQAIRGSVTLKVQGAFDILAYNATVSQGPNVVFSAFNFFPKWYRLEGLDGAVLSVSSDNRGAFVCGPVQILDQVIVGAPGAGGICYVSPSGLGSITDTQQFLGQVQSFISDPDFTRLRASQTFVGLGAFGRVLSLIGTADGDSVALGSPLALATTTNPVILSVSQTVATYECVGLYQRRVGSQDYSVVVPPLVPDSNGIGSWSGTFSAYFQPNIQEESEYGIIAYQVDSGPIAVEWAAYLCQPNSSFTTVTNQ